MSDQNIFNSDDKTEAKNESVEPRKEESKIDLDVVNKRLQDKDEHIKRIEQENAELRKAQERAKTIDEVLEKMKSGSEQDPKPVSTDLLKEVESLVDRKLSIKEQEQERLRQHQLHADNAKKVAAALREVYGDKAEEIFNKKAQEMGEPVEDLHKLAMVKPNVILKAFGLENGPASVNRTQSATADVNTTAVLNNNSANNKISELTRKYFSDPFNSGAVFSELEKEFISRSKDNK